MVAGEREGERVIELGWKDVVGRGVLGNWIEGEAKGNYPMS